MTFFLAKLQVAFPKLVSNERRCVQLFDIRHTGQPKRRKLHYKTYEKMQLELMKQQTG